MARIPDSIKGRFELKANHTTPTNTSMYECLECKEAVLNEEKENHYIKDVYGLPYYGWIWICSGCGKMAGPFSYLPSNDEY